MKVLLVDVGNTRLKWAYSINDKTIERNLFVWQAETLEEFLGSQWSDFDQPKAFSVYNVAGDAVR